MKSMKKIVIMSAVIAMTLLIVSCGKDEKEPEFYGYGGNPCGNMINGFNGYNQFGSYGQYPTVGNFLNGNPNAIFRQGNLCYTGSQLNNAYQQYGAPWSNFAQSPYGNLQMYNPYGGGQTTGNYAYNSNQALNMNWVNAGDFFGGTPFSRYPGNQWGLNFYYWRDREK